MSANDLKQLLTNPGKKAVTVRKPAPVYRKPAAPTGNSRSNNSNRSNGSGSGRSSGSASGGASSGYDPAAEARKLAKAAAKRYTTQAKNMQGQIESIRHTLNVDFMNRLQANLADIDQNQAQRERILMQGFDSRVKDYQDAAEKNENATGDSSFTNLHNRGRERASAIQEALSHGAGESDTLKAQTMALRNWNANQNEINNAFSQTLSSINSSIGQLNQETQSALVDNEMKSNELRGQHWQAYYDARSKGFEDLNDALNRQAELYGLADEQVSSKKSQKRQKTKVKRANTAFNEGALEQGKHYKDPGVSDRIQKWTGATKIGSRQNSVFVGNEAGRNTNIGGHANRRPEGANLRKWDT